MAKFINIISLLCLFFSLNSQITLFEYGNCGCEDEVDLNDLVQELEEQGFTSFPIEVIGPSLTNQKPLANRKSGSIDVYDYSNLQINDGEEILDPEQIIVLFMNYFNSFAGESFEAFITKNENYCLDQPLWEQVETQFYDESHTTSIWFHIFNPDGLENLFFFKIESELESFFHIPYQLAEDIVDWFTADFDYPQAILDFDPDIPLWGGLVFNDAAAYLLSLVSGVPDHTIKQLDIKKRDAFQYRPWYPDCPGGGITIPPTIVYTESFFTLTGDCPQGDDIIAWLSISAHEVRHYLHFLDADSNIAKYVWKFVKQYAEAQSHDGANCEIDADIGSDNFYAFHNWIRVNKGFTALEDLFIDNQGNNISIISQIELWWLEYNE